MDTNTAFESSWEIFIKVLPQSILHNIKALSANQKAAIKYQNDRTEML